MQVVRRRFWTRAKRRVKMAGVLADGGFGDEAVKAAREAVCRAAGSLFLFTTGVTGEQTVEPLTDNMVAAIQADSDVGREQVAVLQAAHLGLEAEPGTLLEKVRTFVEYCAERLDRQRMRG